jgi:UDP-N-acetylmuramate: L-alanyl-gamma-D-glutamyl-meso-diaminopimelate ligase
VDELIGDLRSAGKQAFSIEGADAIVEHLAPELLMDDVVVVMSNGGFGGIHQKLLDAIGQIHS